MSSLSYHTTGQGAHDAIIKDIQDAKHSISIEMFIINVDDTGLRLLNALRAKAKQGVNVTLLADAVGSFSLYRAQTIQEELRADGVRFSFFNHLVPWYPKNLRLWYFRNHRRTVVIDGHISHTGSVCFSNQTREWRETMVRVESETLAKDMEQSFDQMWKLSEHGVFGKRDKAFVEKDVYYLTHSPLPGRRQLYKKFIDLIRDAKEEILITTPYFIPDHRLSSAIQKARKRNVRVAILVPRTSNHPYVDWAGDYDKAVFLKQGVEFYFYHGMIHSKTVVVDKTVAFVGSMNLDNISLHYNFESGLIINNDKAAAELHRHFVEDIQNATAMNLGEWLNRSLSEKILMWMMWPFRKLL